jgi:hypothetical protein
VLVFDQIAAIARGVGGILWLNQDAIREIQAAPYGLSLAIAILLLGTASDVLGNSPLLFINKMHRGRFAIAMGIDFVLSVVRLAIWLCSFWILIDWLRPAGARLINVVLVLGLGYAPMLLGILVVIPFAGPFIGRLLLAWALVAVLVSMAVATNTSLLEEFGPAFVVVLVLVAVRRWSDFATATVLSRISRRLLGIDVTQRTRALDPRQVISAPS